MRRSGDALSIGFRTLLTALILFRQGHVQAAAGLSTTLSYIESGAFPHIEVILSVHTEKGQPVPGLTRDDFTLMEGEIPVSEITVEVDKGPVSVALILDTSGSMLPAMAQMKESVMAFVRSLDSQDRIMMMPFGDRPHGSTETTRDRARVMKEIRSLRASGATALYDAIARGIEGLRFELEGPRIAVVFTDGRDQDTEGRGLQSAIDARGVVKEARQHRVQLWTIGLGNGVDKKLLAQMAALTGGRSYLPASAGQLRAAFDRVLRDVRLRYRLGYETPKPDRDGSERSLTVVSKNRGLQGQGRGSYRAPGPAPEPMPEPASEGTIQTLEAGASQVYVLALKQMPIQFFVWPAEMSFEEAQERGIHKESIFMTGGHVEVAPGEYSVGLLPIYRTSETPLPLGRFQVNPGEAVVLKTPGADENRLSNDLGRHRVVLLAVVRFEGSRSSRVLRIWPGGSSFDEAREKDLDWGILVHDGAEFPLAPGTYEFGLPTFLHSEDVSSMGMVKLGPGDVIVIKNPTSEE